MVQQASHFFRPGIEKMDTERAERRINSGQARQLNKNMWIAYTVKSYRGRGYTTQVIVRNGKNYYWYSVPTNKKGVIPLDAMAQRIMDIADGDRSGQQRNLFVDLAITAQEISKPEELAKSYIWYLYPNEGDIKGIDDANSKLVTVLSKSKSGRKRSLLIVGGTHAQRESMASAINRAFTVKEKEVIAGCLIQIKPIRGAAGTYSGARYAGSGGAVSIITIDPQYANDADTTVIVHECIHALRDLDESRIPELKRQGRLMVGSDIDLEESLTEAENVTREKPLTTHKFAGRGGGYYARIKGKTPAEANDAVLDDRVKINQLDKQKDDIIEKGKKGKTAQKLLKKHYPETEISKLKLHGNIEAIDTFYRIKNRGQTVHLQIYAPKAKVSPKVEKGELETIEYHDGKAVKIAGRQKIRITPKPIRLPKH